MLKRRSMSTYIMSCEEVNFFNIATYLANIWNDLEMILTESKKQTNKQKHTNKTNSWQTKKKNKRTYFWGICGSKNRFGVLCGAFWNITFSFLLILTTSLKTNPKLRSMSFYILFVAWKLVFLTKNNYDTLP